MTQFPACAFDERRENAPLVFVPGGGVGDDRIAPDCGSGRALPAPLERPDQVEGDAVQCRKFFGGRDLGHHRRSIARAGTMLDSAVVRPADADGTMER